MAKTTERLPEHDARRDRDRELLAAGWTRAQIAAEDAYERRLHDEARDDHEHDWRTR